MRHKNYGSILKYVWKDFRWQKNQPGNFITSASPCQNTKHFLTLHSASACRVCQTRVICLAAWLMGNPVRGKEHLSVQGSDSSPEAIKREHKRCSVTVTASDWALTGTSALMDLHFLRGSAVQSLRLSDDHWLWKPMFLTAISRNEKSLSLSAFASCELCHR